MDVVEVEPPLVAEAKRLVLAGDHGLAMERLWEHLAQEPDDARAWYRLAGALIGADRLDEAIGAAQRSVALDPGGQFGHHYLALAHALAGDSVTALPSAAQAVALDPSFAQGHALHAEILLLSGAPLSQVVAAARRATALGSGQQPGRRVLRQVRAIRWALPLAFGATATAVAAAGSAVFALLVGIASVRTGLVVGGGAAGCLAASLLLRLVVARLRLARPVEVSRWWLLVAGPVGGLLTAGVASAAGGTSRVTLVAGLFTAVFVLLPIADAGRRAR